MTPFALFMVAAAGVPGGVYHTPAPKGSAATASFLPDETCPFAIKDGVAEALPFLAFDTRFLSLGNIANLKPLNEKQAADRKVILARLAARGRATTPEQAAGIAADQVRLGNDAAALAVLAPFTRAEPLDFRVAINYSHAFASRGEWDSASRFHGLAMSRPGFPREIPGIRPEQLPWLERMENRYYAKWLTIHHFRRITPETEEPFPLFGDVKYVNDAGVYEPGVLSAEERKKLPADAIAVVQQLLLWSPGDASLYWLLGELYAADGQLEEAKVIFDRCVDTRGLSNRKVLKDHRTSVMEALAARVKPAEPPAADPDDGLPAKRTVYIILGIFVPLALLLLVFQLRVFFRKLARKRSGS